MGGLSKEQKAIISKVDEILWNNWDPLGVNDFDEARDEYTSYALPIAGIKLNGGDAAAISEKLYYYEKDWMGLPGNVDRCRKIADQIMKL